MKKLHLLLLSITLCVFSACHNELWEAIDGLDSRVTKLEELCKEMNTNITSLQTIVDVLQANDYITGIVEIKKDGKVVMDREAWRAAIHGVVKSRTRLSN